MEPEFPGRRWHGAAAELGLGRRESIAVGLQSLGGGGSWPSRVVGGGEWSHRRVQARTLLWRFRKTGSKSRDHYSPIFLLTAFSCWFRTFCSDFVMWPPF